MKKFRPGSPLGGFLFLGIVLTLATIFEVGFFSRLPKDEPGCNLLLVLFGGPYIFLLLCSAIIIVVWMVRSKQD
jgi:hypothetical protein